MGLIYGQLGDLMVQMQVVIQVMEPLHTSLKIRIIIYANLGDRQVIARCVG